MDKNKTAVDSNALLEKVNDDNANTAIRRSTYIPTPDDITLLKEMGFDGGMIRKVEIFLKPNNITGAIDLMTEVDGIYQHDFYDNKTNLCFICKKEKKYHRDYIKNKDIVIPINDREQELQINQRREAKNKEECLICLEEFNVNAGNRLPCNHFC